MIDLFFYRFIVTDEPIFFMLKGGERMAKAFSNDPLVPVGVRVPENLVKKIDEEARKHKLTRTDFLIALIEDYFRNQEAA